MEGLEQSNARVYRLGPVTIRSASRLPFSEVEDRSADAELFLTGAFPAKSEKAETDFMVSWEGRQAWISLSEEVVAFVADGNIVCVDPRVIGARRRFVIQTAIAILLVQRGMLLLHGSAVADSAGAKVFLGPSGAGKSTAACWHALQGSTFLCDDLVPLFCDSIGLVRTFEFDSFSALVPKPHPDAGWISTALQGRACGVRIDGKKRFEVGEGDSVSTYPIEQITFLNCSELDSCVAGDDMPSDVISFLGILNSLVSLPLARAILGRQHLEIATRLVGQSSVGKGAQRLSVEEPSLAGPIAVAKLPCHRELAIP